MTALALKSDVEFEPPEFVPLRTCLACGTPLANPRQVWVCNGGCLKKLDPVPEWIPYRKPGRDPCFDADPRQWAEAEPGQVFDRRAIAEQIHGAGLDRAELTFTSLCHAPFNLGVVAVRAEGQRMIRAIRSLQPQPEPWGELDRRDHDARWQTLDDLESRAEEVLYEAVHGDIERKAPDRPLFTNVMPRDMDDRILGVSYAQTDRDDDEGGYDDEDRDPGPALRMSDAEVATFEGVPVSYVRVLRRAANQREGERLLPAPDDAMPQRVIDPQASEVDDGPQYGLPVLKKDNPDDPKHRDALSDRVRIAWPKDHAPLPKAPRWIRAAGHFATRADLRAWLDTKPTPKIAGLDAWHTVLGKVEGEGTGRAKDFRRNAGGLHGRGTAFLRKRGWNRTGTYDRGKWDGKVSDADQWIPRWHELVDDSGIPESDLLGRSGARGGRVSSSEQATHGVLVGIVRQLQSEGIRAVVLAEVTGINARTLKRYAPGKWGKTKPKPSADERKRRRAILSAISREARGTIGARFARTRGTDWKVRVDDELGGWWLGLYEGQNPD